MATIVKRPRNINRPWAVRWYDEAGKQREQSFKLRSEAKDFLVKLEHDTRTGTFVDPKLGNEPFTEACQRYVEQLAVGPASKRTYTTVLANQLKPAFDGRTLEQVAADRDGITRLLNTDLAGMSDSRRQIARSLITGTLDEAMLGGRISQHRAARIKLLTGSRAPSRADFVFPSYAQLCALAKDLEANRVQTRGLGLTVWLMRGCGLRISEVFAVREDSFRGDVLRIFEQVAPDGRGTAPLKHRRAGEYREMPVPGYVQQALARHVREQGTRDGFLFTGARVPFPMHRTYVKAFRYAAGLAGIPAGFTPHSLRHGYASALLSHGVPISDVAHWLGHRSIEVTFGTYGHLLPSGWETARVTLDAEYAAWSAA